MSDSSNSGSSGFLPYLETFAKGSLATVGTLATISAGLIYYGQNYLIYPSAYMNVGPDNGVVDTPKDYGLVGEELDLRTSDGINVRAYLLRQCKELPIPIRFAQLPTSPLNYDESETDDDIMARRPTIIMFHGNGGNFGHRIPLGMMFQMFMRCNVLMLSYRGYGGSEGSPSEKGLQIDAQTALDFVRSDSRLSRTPIVLYGQSIGGAVAIDLASRNPSKVTALMLENTFMTLPSLVPHVLPVLGPFTFLCHQKWDSASKIHLIPHKTPILLLSGAKDQIVPPEHMQGLRDLVSKRGSKDGVRNPEERSRWEQFEHGSHNDTTAQRGYWNAIEEFLESLRDKSEVGRL
ncbi:bem46 family protein [Moniliophthora roreri MCA 2997]|uniref:Bem46 family protein n=1 Tax=Moniliophthora roreri (strain MCA 2997) TaxID=1381753 RepID=V2XI59_MONRO|nr:bem46 family protein [Moniliophthora roreri MCA 2997]